jgi:hypothetical protein
MGTVNEVRSCEHEREFHAHYHELLLQLKDNIIFNKLAFLFQNSLFHFVEARGIQYALTNFEIRSVRPSTVIRITSLLFMK